MSGVSGSITNVGTPLDAEAIRSRLSPATARAVQELRVLWSTDSTNARLLEGTRPREGAAFVLLAEQQSAGRGRRGRTWLAPPGGAICLSIGWSFARLPPDVGALSLAIGICARRALADCGAAGVMLKWPNDLVVDGAKLGGILIELHTEAAGPAFAVVGIGLNVALDAGLRDAIGATGTQATDLAALGLERPDRNLIAARLIERCIAGLEEFEVAGLRVFAAEWREADALRGRQITVHAAGGTLAGIARGIDVTGALMLETAAGLRSVVAGEVSVRAEQ